MRDRGWRPGWAGAWGGGQGRGRLTGLALPSAGALLRGATIRRTEPTAGSGDSARRFGTQRVLVEPDAAAGKCPERGLPSARLWGKRGALAAERASLGSAFDLPQLQAQTWNPDSGERSNF